MIGRNPHAGVTLLETMIALLLMAMMAVMVSATFGSSIRILARSGSLNGDLQQALARRDFRLWLENALPVPVPDEATPVFTGTASGFVALTLPPGDMFWPGHATEVTLSADATVMANGQSENGEPLSVRMQLAPKDQRIALRYWGRTAPDKVPGWRDDWPDTAPLPDLVQIRFLGLGRRLPPLTIRLAKATLQSEMSLSSLVPPALPSRP